MFGNGAINFSDDVLTASAKALAIMVLRFVPQNESCFYSARNIWEILQGLQFGNSTSLCADIDSLKLGLMNRSFRTALSEAFPGRFLFDKSQASGCIISKGKNKFKHGSMIKFITSSPPSLRKNKDQLISDVTALSASLLLHATSLLGDDPPLVLQRISPLKIPAIPTEIPAPLKIPAIPIEIPPISDSAAMFPRELIDDKNKKLKQLRSSLSYFKNINSTNEKSTLSIEKTVEKSIGDKLIDLITEANVLTKVINGKPTLSIVTGLLVQDLVSNCGCSMSKIPMIVTIRIISDSEMYDHVRSIEKEKMHE